MTDLDDSFAKLIGRQPSDAERQQLYNVRDALGLQNNDALWLILMALQYYQHQYEQFPTVIARASKDILADFKAAADATVKASAESAKAELAQAVATTAQEVAHHIAEKEVAAATTKKAIWMVGGGLTGLAMFGMGVSYGAIYSAWTNPAWIDRSGLLSVLSSALLKTPTGGVGCIVIALTLLFLQKSLNDLIAKNEADETPMKFLVYFFAAAFAVAGIWLSFLMMFK